VRKSHEKPPCRRPETPAITASRGIARAPLLLLGIGAILVGSAVFAFRMDAVKVPLFNRTRIAQEQFDFLRQSTGRDPTPPPL
jgi:hypothetical protein